MLCLCEDCQRLVGLLPSSLNLFLLVAYLFFSVMSVPVVTAVT